MNVRDHLKKPSLQKYISSRFSGLPALSDSSSSSKTTNRIYSKSYNTKHEDANHILVIPEFRNVIAKDKNFCDTIPFRIKIDDDLDHNDHHNDRYDHHNGDDDVNNGKDGKDGNGCDYGDGCDYGNDNNESNDLEGTQNNNHIFSRVTRTVVKDKVLKNDRVAMAVKILPNIYLGDKRAACSSSFFSKANVTSVLNMTPNVMNSFCSNECIEYLRIPVYDSHGKRDLNKMYQYFPVITEFMYKVSVMENKNLLVHCALGRQRSCAAIAAYLIKFYKMTPMEAMDYIMIRKPDSFHWGKSANFAKSLNKWYHKLNTST